MDEHYAQIARDKIEKSIAELVGAEDYLIKADAPIWLIESVRRIMSGLCNRQRNISNQIIYQRKHKAG